MTTSDHRSPADNVGRDAWRNHGTKILGYITVAAGAAAVMDPQLVSDTLSANALFYGSRDGFEPER